MKKIFYVILLILCSLESEVIIAQPNTLFEKVNYAKRQNQGDFKKIDGIFSYTGRVQGKSNVFKTSASIVGLHYNGNITKEHARILSFDIQLTDRIVNLELIESNINFRLLNEKRELQNKGEKIIHYRGIIKGA